MWRPKGWDSLKIVRDFGDIGNDEEIGLVDAGADAMLEALRAKPSSISIIDYPEYYGEKPKNGKWVFIPDEVGG